MTIDKTNLPGIHRTGDGSRLSLADAIDEWTPIAYRELVAAAQHYNSVITYLELADRVQKHSGVKTRMLLTNWIGKVLESVAIQAKENGEPPITSLCVRQDGTIGPGYALAPKSVPDSPTEDIEQYAAEHRLLCYRAYASDLPEDGGQPSLTKAVVEQRARSASRQEKPPRLCPNCFLTVPSTGTCDACDW